MWKLNESGMFLNDTNDTFDYQLCTGSMPSITVQLVLFSLILISSLVGNVLVVAVFVRDKTLRTSVNYFIVNMSISDLTVSMISLPVWISFTVGGSLWLTKRHFIPVFCKVACTTWSISTQISLFSMTLLAAGRFRAIIFPTKPALFSERRTFVAIAAMWISSVAFYGLYSGDESFGYASYIPCIDSDRASKKFVFFLIFFGLTSLFVLVVTGLYLKMAVFLYRQKNSLHLAAEVVKKRVKRNRKIIFMLLIIVILFYVAWIPFYVMQFVSYTNPSVSLPCLFVWLADYILPLLYPVINPIVYFVFNEKYRQGFKEILYYLWFCIKGGKEDSQQKISLPQKNHVDKLGHVNQALENTELHQR